MQSTFVSKLSFMTLNLACKDCKVFIGTSCTSLFNKFWIRKKNQTNKQTISDKTLKLIDLLQYTPIQWVFTIFGPVLMKPLLHQCKTFDSWNQYKNCVLRKICCIMFAHCIWIRIWIWDTAVYFRDTVVMTWLDYSLTKIRNMQILHI